METCKTFDTEKESCAFMLGFRLGRSKQIEARLDSEELQTVLIDCNSDKAELVYSSAILDYREDCVTTGIADPAQQYAHDCELPNGD